MTMHSGCQKCLWCRGAREREVEGVCRAVRMCMFVRPCMCMSVPYERGAVWEQVSQIYINIYIYI